MTTERYRFDVDVVTGEGILLDELVRFVDAQGRGTTGLVLLGRRASEVEPRSDLRRRLESLGARVVRFSGGYYRPAELAAWLEQNSAGRPADWVVAVGGGRVVDAAKLLALRMDGTEAVRRLTSVEALRGALGSGDIQAVPTCVAPTVAGSGAESSMSVDILLDDDGVRSPVTAPDLFATCAVLDGELLRSAPPAITGPALVQSLVGILDPWLNDRPADPRLAKHLLADVVRLARQAVHGPLSGPDWLHLARVNHVALRPGLARTSAHVANIHRIEHALEPSRFASQGAALAFTTIRMLRWAESHRREHIESFAAGVADAFGRDHRPSHLFQTLVRDLAIPGIDDSLTPTEISMTLTRLRRLQSGASILPGSLGLTLDDVGELLAAPVPASRMVAEANRPLLARAAPHPGRVFGREAAPQVSTLVVTPVAAVFEELQRRGDGTAPAWYPTTLVRSGDRHIVAIQTPVGRSALVDALDLATAWLPRVKRAVFLGLAAALDGSVPPTTVVRPGRVLSTQGLGLAGDEFTLAEGSGDWCVASVDQIVDECSAVFDYLRWRGAALLDLECASFCQWCVSHRIEACIALAVSDIAADIPIWALDRTQATVIQKGAVELVNQLLDSEAGRVD